MTTNDWRQVIASLYFYVMIAVGVILVSVGSFTLLAWGSKVVLLDNYPLGYEENRCQYLEVTAPKMDPQAALSAEDTEKSYQRCLSALDKEREVRKVTDLTKAISLGLVGAGIIGFHLVLRNKKLV